MSSNVVPLDSRRSSWRWTRELLIEQLQDAAFVLDKTPKLDEARRVVKLPSGETICKLFGSYHDALVAAGLATGPGPRRPTRWTREKIIAALQGWVADLGRTPTVHEACRAGVPVHPSVVRQHFGSWNAGLEAAGLPTREPAALAA